MQYQDWNLYGNALYRFICIIIAMMMLNILQQCYGYCRDFILASRYYYSLLFNRGVLNRAKLLKTRCKNY
ncbi:hypothetical protein V1524DRAFT_441635 [Lipomyces starkeyi]